MCQGGTAETNKKNRAGHKHQSGATENPELNVSHQGCSGCARRGLCSVAVELVVP